MSAPLPRDYMQLNFELKLQNNRLNKQMKLMLNSFDSPVTFPCPSNVGLKDSWKCGHTCKECWHEALEGVE